MQGLQSDAMRDAQFRKFQQTVSDPNSPNSPVNSWCIGPIVIGTEYYDIFLQKYYKSPEGLGYHTAFSLSHA
jgi:hypothetical protein